MIYEKFESNLNSGNETLDNAYSGDSLNIISNNMTLDLGANTIAEAVNSNTSNTELPNDFHQHIELEDAKFDFNVWDLLGIKNLGKDKHNCLMDCGIKSLNSLEKCNKDTKLIYEVFDTKNKQKCKMKSYKNALICAKECYNLDNSVDYVTPNNLLVNNINSNINSNSNRTMTPTTSTYTTSSLSTTSVVNNNNNNNSNTTEQNKDLNAINKDIGGLYSSMGNYSPFEAKYWPGENKYGWDTDDIEDYNQKLSNKVIEVRSKQYTDFNISKPFIEFGTQVEESKSKNFFPYTSQDPNLAFNYTHHNMLLHEVEGFQNPSVVEGFQNPSVVEGFQNPSVVEGFQNPSVVVKDKVFESGQYILDRKCPHKGCKLYYDKSDKEFKCPCHHSKFNLKGDCISGPACPSNIRI